jgi:hypothetical protein
MRHLVVWYNLTDVSKKLVLSIYSKGGLGCLLRNVGELFKQVTRHCIRDGSDFGKCHLVGCKDM